ncbi:acrEF/envCD operon transcriptional regulator, partial [Cronobacter sakazakii]
LQYIAEVPRQQALLQILYHKCEFQDDMISEREIREKIGFNQQALREALQACMAEGMIPGTLDLDVALIIICGSFSGILKNWLMNPASYNLYEQAPALVDNVLSMLSPDGNVRQLIKPTNIHGEI